jgi:hypothetical protein
MSTLPQGVQDDLDDNFFLSDAEFGLDGFLRFKADDEVEGAFKIKYGFDNFSVYIDDHRLPMGEQYGTIDVDFIDEEMQEHVVRGTYGSLDELSELLEHDSNEINRRIAECYFYQEYCHG